MDSRNKLLWGIMMNEVEQLTEQEQCLLFRVLEEAMDNMEARNDEEVAREMSHIIRKLGGGQ